MNGSSSSAASLQAALPAGTTTVKAPLFYSLVERMHAGGRWVVLDLGPARAATIELFSQFRCHLSITDLGSQLELLRDPEQDIAPEALAEAVLLERREEATDLVLCWDLLNYLQPPVLSAVMAQVAARTRPGALVHALIVYSASRMPVQPGHWIPCAGDQLANLPATDQECEAPRYTPDDLGRHMPGYRVERAVLLRNGMQEFLFRAGES